MRTRAASKPVGGKRTASDNEEDNGQDGLWTPESDENQNTQKKEGKKTPKNYTSKEQGGSVFTNIS